MRLKTITLEMVYGIFDLKDAAFFKKEPTVRVIKDRLFSGLLKCCLNSEKSIFSLSFGIFLQLLIYHKEEFKNEVSILINEIFLSLLESPNSSAIHRHLTLQVLNKPFSKTRLVLDFYVNYDCSFNQVQLVERIVSILSIKMMLSTINNLVFYFPSLPHPRQDFYWTLQGPRVLNSNATSLRSAAEALRHRDASIDDEIDL